MPNTPHTPTPWAANEGPHVIRGPKRIVVAKLSDSHEPYEIKAANAAHIVRCVNSHEALLDALRMAVSLIEHRPELKHRMDLITRDERNQLVNALKQAEA